MTTTAKKLSAGRLRCLQGLAFGALQLEGDEKARLVERIVPGKTAFHELTNAEADKLIDAMKGMAGQAVTRPQDRFRREARRGVATGDVVMLPTPAQRERLGELVRALIAAGISANYVSGVKLRACQQPSPTTSGDYEKVIEALKGVKARVDNGWRPREGDPA